MNTYTKLVVVAMYLLTAGSTGLADHRMKIMFGSCAKDPRTQIFLRMAEERPDLVLMLGDNIYLPPSLLAPEPVITELYRGLLDSPTFRILSRTAPVYAIWDDHDFGWNNADHRYPYRAISRRAFREAWPRNPPPPPGLEESIAYTFRVGEVQFLMTDGRTFRTNPGGDRPTMFGDRQLTWIEETLRTSAARVIVLGSGNQIMPSAGRDESLSNFPAERERLLSALAATKAMVVVVSGDRHMSELYRVAREGKVMIEATSSPLSAGIANEQYVADEPDRLGIYREKENFGIVEIVSGARSSVAIRIVNRDGEEVLRHHEDFGRTGSD
jgi:alkaline phosphatase D